MAERGRGPVSGPVILHPPRLCHRPQELPVRASRATTDRETLPGPSTSSRYVSGSLQVLYTGLFLPRVIFALFRSQTVSPSLEFVQTKLCLKKII